MRAREFIIETPRVAAHRPEILSATDDGKTITIKVRTHDGSVRTISNSNPAVLQQQLNLKYGLRLPHSIARKFVGMPTAMAEDQADNPDSWESQAADAERDEETDKMAAQDAEAGGLAEETVDEDLSRRGFLKGAGAAALAGAAGSAMAQSRPVDVSREFQNMRQDDPRVQHNKDIEEMTRAIYDQIVATRGQPIDRRQQQMWMTIAREKATEKLSKYTPGRSAPQSQSSGFPAQGSERRVSRNIDNFESQGVAAGSMNEKSTSQAQFRTMAAAAHNPKFAKKVGISPDVAREFHGADKKSNYKSLPRKAAEDASWGMAPESQGYKK